MEPEMLYSFWPMNNRVSSSICALVLFSLRGIMLIISFIYCKTGTILLIDYQLYPANQTFLNFHLILDPMGTTLSTTVLFISANIITFTTFYIQEEKFLSRFTHLIILFILSINILIFFPHFIFLLLGWDGLGLTSFLLVIYYYSPKSLGAGIITALTNRIGDVLILISIRWMLTQGHWNIIYIWENIHPYIFIFITLAAITKRAQIPFSSWLPAAIAAPTPVSALVHSSTLVTAGVFLLIRFYPFLSKSYLFSKFLLLIATITIFIAGAAATLESDLKKIIALSTLSQLGVIITAIALNSPFLALFHLITHALFKALLFVTAGSLIAANNHIQDLRSVGRILTQMPLTSSAFLVSNMALCAIPFLAGFYSKDLILEINSYNNNNIIIFIILTTATALTSAYSIRFLITGWAAIRNFHPNHTVLDLNKYRIIPALILGSGAIAGGSFNNWIYLSPFNESIISITSKLTPLIVTIAGFIIATILASYSNSIIKSYKTILFSQSLIWFLTPISTQIILKSPLKLRILINNLIDQGWAEYMGGQGTFKISSTSAFIITKPQKNIPLIHLTIISFILSPILFLL